MDDDQDLLYLKNKIKEYKKLIKDGLSSQESARIISKNHMDGMELSEYQEPIILYKGKYLLLTFEKKIYKKID